MSVTVVDSGRGLRESAQIASSGLRSFSNVMQGISSQKLQKAQLEESKLSGISNRAQQEALTEQASATAAATRQKTKIINSLPPKVAQGIYSNALDNQKSQIFAQQAQMKSLIQQQQLDKAQAIQAFQVSQQKSQAEIQQVKASSAQVMQAFDEQNKALTIEKQQREQRLADFNDITKGMDVAGTNAAREAFMQNKPLNEIGEIGLAADQEASASLLETKRAQDIAAKKATTKSLQKSPAQSKREAKTFGESTYERRQNAEANAQPTQPTIKISFDKTPGRFKIGGKGDFAIDYPESVELGKEKEWLKGYEETFGEPYDIPESQKSEIEKANGKPDKEIQPPAAIVKLRDEKYPGAEIVFRDGKWGVVQ